MRFIAIAAVLLVTLGVSGLAAAQGRAPVGHRQPTTKDLPPGQGTAPVQQTKEDRALDRALKGICRGC